MQKSKNSYEDRYKEVQDLLGKAHRQMSNLAEDVLGEVRSLNPNSLRSEPLLILWNTLAGVKTEITDLKEKEIEFPVFAEPTTVKRKKGKAD